MNEGAAHINMFDDYIQIYDENCKYLGDFEWFYLVAAIQSMWNEVALENVKSEKESLPVLKNDNQRKEWLSNYKAWGLWYYDEHIDVNYYKFDFPDGSRLIVAEYCNRKCYWRDGVSDEAYYHLLEKNREGYKGSYDKQYVHAPDSETYLVDFLKRLQKK